MQRFDQNTAICRMFVYKDGLLSYLTHDLRIDVNKFIIELGGPDHFITAHFDARSLNVYCAMEKGLERPELLSPMDRNMINRIMLTDVLKADIYPDIMLKSSSVEKEESRLQVKAPIVLHGQKQEVSFSVKQQNNCNHVADVRLHLPDFGIRLFSFLFGAVKIRPDVLVHIELPAANVES